MNKPRRVISGLCAAVVLQACAAPQTVPVTVAFQSQQCRIEKAGIQLVTDQQQLHDFMAKAGGLVTHIALPTFDFSSEAGALVAMGQQTSAGYSISLASPQATLDKGVLTLDISTSQPQGMAAMVITSPCLLLKITRQGVNSVKRSDSGQMAHF